MIKKTTLLRCSAWLLAAAVLGGCSAPVLPGNMVEETAATLQTKPSGPNFEYTVVPEDFSISLHAGEDTVSAAASGSTRRVSEYVETDGEISWQYPEEGVSVTVKPVDNYLSVEITSQTSEDNTFTWPVISASDYYLPLGEGKHVPAAEPVWKEYLHGQEVSALEQLSMPFWASEAGDYSVLYIMENPYRTSLDFTGDSQLSFAVSHEYPAIDSDKTNRYRIYLTENNPVSIAKTYKGYVEEKGDFLTLEEKAAQNPEVSKLYGAPFIYLWGDHVISSGDILWPQFREALDSQAMKDLLAKADTIENGEEFKAVISEIRTQDYVAEYQKNVVCTYLSQVLKQEDNNIQANKSALADSLPGVFKDVDTWMEADTTGLLTELKARGINQAWIGLNSWEQAYAKPELVQTAVDQGYLIASYDSYHSIHEPGNEKWITAKFDDTSLYEDATVTLKTGEKASGFQKEGRKLNPTLSMPAVEQRMKQIFQTGLLFNSWFIDCDATGEILDDYSPNHITTQQQDLAARLERMKYIKDTYQLVIGSEGGHDFAASTIAYAHGIELKSFSWMDDDMKDADSQYYIGKYYNPTGGVAEHFSKRIPIKDTYDTLFVSPEYDVPLYKLVYNDSVITTYHWDWSTFKIEGATKERMLREILYNVPPLYHLDAAEWSRYQEDIINHTKVWSEFSQAAILEEMTDFAYVEADGTVQRTEYGEAIRVIANFNQDTYDYLGQEIPGESVLIEMNGNSFIYTPKVAEENA